MPGQVPVATVMNAFDFLPSEGEEEFDVVRSIRIMCEFVGGVGTGSQERIVYPDIAVELETIFTPMLEPLLPLRRMAEELHFGLFEFATPEREVPRRDLVSEGLAYLRDAKGDLLASRFTDSLETTENWLAGFRPQERGGRLINGSAELRRQHQVEVPSLGKIVASVVVFFSRRRAFFVRDLIRTKALVAPSTIDHRVTEIIDVTGSFPGPRVRDDGAVDTDNVFTLAHHSAPPELLQVIFEFDTQRAVVPKPGDAAIDLAGGINEPASGTKGDERLHSKRMALSTLVGGRSIDRRVGHVGF